ncbi:hypothetical protein [Burkholderia sp. MSMB0856]|uniref:hypothetical protein n=1 Tax=Burkholderia sp. MSMB0856 TaxID=1637869 RepID=UPI00131F38CC|nr:hypothetical protein [Burkholderia sp. MSMB0856]
MKPEQRPLRRFVVCRVARAGCAPSRVRVAGIRVPRSRPRIRDSATEPAFIDIERRCLTHLRDSSLIARHLSAASFYP